MRQRCCWQLKLQVVVNLSWLSRSCRWSAQNKNVQLTKWIKSFVAATPKQSFCLCVRVAAHLTITTIKYFCNWYAEARVSDWKMLNKLQICVAASPRRDVVEQMSEMLLLSSRTFGHSCRAPLPQFSVKKTESKGKEIGRSVDGIGCNLEHFLRKMQRGQGQQRQRRQQRQLCVLLGERGIQLTRKGAGARG